MNVANVILSDFDRKPTAFYFDFDKEEKNEEKVAVEMCVCDVVGVRGLMRYICLDWCLKSMSQSR